MDLINILTSDNPCWFYFCLFLLRHLHSYIPTYCWIEGSRCASYSMKLSAWLFLLCIKFSFLTIHTKGNRYLHKANWYCTCCIGVCHILVMLGLLSRCWFNSCTNHYMVIFIRLSSIIYRYTMQLPRRYTGTFCTLNIWNVNCARATAFIFQ